MHLIVTTRGLMEEDRLDRTLGFEFRPDKLVVWVEWKYEGELVRRDAWPSMTKEIGEKIETTEGMVNRLELDCKTELMDNENDISIARVWTRKGILVRRDAHVILKRMPEEVGKLLAEAGKVG